MLWRLRREYMADAPFLFAFPMGEGARRADRVLSFERSFQRNRNVYSLFVFLPLVPYPPLARSPFPMQGRLRGAALCADFRKFKETVTQHS